MSDTTDVMPVCRLAAQGDAADAAERQPVSWPCLSMGSQTELVGEVRYRRYDRYEAHGIGRRDFKIKSYLDKQ